MRIVFKHIILTCALLMAVLLPAKGQITVPAFYGSHHVEVYNNYLLDTLSGAHAVGAYALIKLKGTATKAVRVRRASDNTEKNIGFVGAAFDTATLHSFCASTTCYITTLYDQSGNGYDFTQTTAVNQYGINDTEIIMPGSPTTLTYLGGFFTYTGDGAVYTVLNTSDKNAGGANQFNGVFTQNLGDVGRDNEMVLALAKGFTPGIPGDIYGKGSSVRYGSADHNINQYYVVTFAWQNWNTVITNSNTKIYWNNAENTPYSATGAVNPSALSASRMDIGKSNSQFAPYYFQGKMKCMIFFNAVNPYSITNNALNLLFHVY